MNKDSSYSRFHCQDDNALVGNLVIGTPKKKFSFES